MLGLAKLKIYYLLSKEAYLEPVSGDRINEINVIKALSKYFDVFYNGELCDAQESCFGRKDKRIVLPKAEEYDLVYVRANSEVFLKSPHPKIWFASPYDEECFNEADGIACMTKPWQSRLSTYSEVDYDYFVQTYPQTMAPPSKCLLFPQAITIPSTSDVSAPVKKGFSFKQIIHRLKGKAVGDFKLCHFGPVRPSNVPHQLSYYMSSSDYFKNTFDAVAVGAGNKVDLGTGITKRGRVPQHEAFQLLVNADAVWYNQDSGGNIGGSLKVLEAMAVGTPILLPRLDARVAELGAEYPFFWELEPGSSITDPVQPDFVRAIKQLKELTQNERKELSEYLKFRAENHSVDSVAQVLREQIDGFMESYHGK